MKCEIGVGELKKLVSAVPRMSGLRGPAWDRALESAVVVQETHGNSVCQRHDNEHFGIVLRGSLVLRVHSPDGRMFNSHKVPVGEMCMLSVAMASNNAWVVPASAARLGFPMSSPRATCCCFGCPPSIWMRCCRSRPSSARSRSTR